ncbi:response regulator [Ferrimonas marina]|uniref:Response regulator receiver domain-containing protein n=1 Tax=Ferrimonas marina TaxID=299255 RepID=A0A1M5VKP5_9GAMM|nr:response regulator [Ferrimonas marina]SHH75811.1 Response regulator receiver domain-containing protein [Ferrimonas marina]
MELQGIRVLIVEDDPVFRQLVGDYCRQQGMVVDEAEDGQQGLERFQAQQPDLALVDLGMPRMGGLELLTRLADIAPQVPSIVITANKAMSDVVDALRNGAWDYLMKPLSDLRILQNAMLDCLRESGGLEPPEATNSVGTEWEDPSQTLAMSDNIEALKSDPHTAQMVQAQLFPKPEVVWQSCEFAYNLYKNEPVSDRLCDGFECGDNHYCAYLAKVTPAGNMGAFVSVLIRSFFNQKLKRYRQGGSTAVLEPFTMLCYLNEQLVKSGLNCALEMAYLVFDRRTRRVAIGRAGSELKIYLRSEEWLSRVMLPDTQPIGLNSQARPHSHFRHLEPGQALVLMEGEEQVRDDLLADRFTGLNEGAVEGSCVQLKASA